MREFRAGELLIGFPERVFRQGLDINVRIDMAQALPHVAGTEVSGQNEAQPRGRLEVVELEGVCAAGVKAAAPARRTVCASRAWRGNWVQKARRTHFLGDILATSCFSEKRKPNISFWSCLISEGAEGRFHSR